MNEVRVRIAAQGTPEQVDRRIAGSVATVSEAATPDEIAVLTASANKWSTAAVLRSLVDAREAHGASERALAAAELAWAMERQLRVPAGR